MKKKKEGGENGVANSKDAQKKNTKFIRLRIFSFFQLQLSVFSKRGGKKKNEFHRRGKDRRGQQETALLTATKMSQHEYPYKREEREKAGPVRRKPTERRGGHNLLLLLSMTSKKEEKGEEEKGTRSSGKKEKDALLDASTVDPPLFPPRESEKKKRKYWQVVETLEKKKNMISVRVFLPLDAGRLCPEEKKKREGGFKCWGKREGQGGTDLSQHNNGLFLQI